MPGAIVGDIIGNVCEWKNNGIKGYPVVSGVMCFHG